MKIQFIGFAATANNTLAIPAHKAGDTIIMLAFTPGVFVIPLTPGGEWVALASNSSSTATREYGALLAYKVALSDAETSGTWASTAALMCLVYRGARAVAPIRNNFMSATAGYSGAYSYAAIPTFYQPNKSSWAVSVVANGTNTATVNSPPAGMTLRGTSSNSECAFGAQDTNGPVTGWAGGSGANSIAGVNINYAFELRAAARVSVCG